MMKMLRDLGLAVCVVCIAAFASGCGGGGGGGTAEEMPPPVMECPQGQVGTYPNCTDPGPTDEQRIATARETIAGIVNDANRIEQAARSAVTAVEASADATVEQIASVRAEGNAALDALRAIVRASGVATTATTPAAAEGAVTSARAALTNLSNAQSAAAAIQRAVDAVANLREQEAETERLATNGSSLIQHVRANKIVYDAVIADMKTVNAETLVISPTGATATYPAFTGSGATRKAGARGVTVTPVSGTVLSSDSTTSKITGTGHLPYGFDLKSGTTFVNAYTDITRENPSANTGLADDPSTTGAGNNEAVAAKTDDDYLLAGIWLTGNAVKAFAHGGQLLSAARPGDDNPFDECNSYERPTTPATTTCTSLTSGFDMITSIVDAGEQETATYRGDANGAYLAGGAMSYFTANVELTAVFQNAVAGATGGSGKIAGEVTNIVAAGKSINGSIELRETTLDNDISGVFPASGASLAVGVVAGESYRGGWKGRFFGQRISGAKRTTDTEADPVTTTITFSPLMPGSVAGTFNVIKESGTGDAAFIGAFGAHRPRP